MKYISTRGRSEPASFEEVLLAGMAPDGGLYIPECWPRMDERAIAALAGRSYVEVAHSVIGPYVAGALSDEELRCLLVKTYEEGNFTHKALAPLVQVDSNLFIMELFHGPTIAFKDYALQFLGNLFDHILEKRGERVTIVGATSGDTGSAAIEACRGCKNIDIFILHPKGRVSEVQRKQMTSVNAPNVHNIALHGDFDDCQALVKEMFADETFRKDMNLSAVNSINWARIIAQTVYYFAGALALGAPGRKVSFAVPTGNFGNVFAAYVGKQMGLPIDQLTIGTNRNDILTRFFETGAMTRETVKPTISPSMDIQVSSNFERYLFGLLDHDSARLCAMMNDFKTEGAFLVTSAELERARADFTACRSSEEDTAATIRTIHAETGYLLDPHTAVGVHAALTGRTDPSVPLVALACAHPAKFPDAVEKASGIRPPLPDHLADLLEREELVSELENDLVRAEEFVRAAIIR
ncbi:MAG: threonine synthase [Alphaproteobacteria bacterium]|nr:threonine synthase [Alphaproteobacteria bacterium]